ncbi:MAG: DNA polymerase, partial [Candidatus Bathyarchaeia archaeon]
MRVLPFALIEPKLVQARINNLGYPLFIESKDELIDLLLQHPKNEILFIDYETKGNQPHKDDTYVIGIGLSNSLGSIYIDLRESYSNCWKDFCYFIHHNEIACGAHNVAYDGLWSLRDFGLWFNWKVCTYGAYRHLASEGFNGQKWGLKSVQVDVLGWEETNEAELDQWLIDNGYKLHSGNPDKSKMYLAPPDILGYYCVLDAESTYLFYTHILRPLFQKFKQYQIYHETYFLPLVQSISEGYLRGIAIDKVKMQAYSLKLMERIIEKHHAFYQGDICTAIQSFNDLAIQEMRGREPHPAYKKREELGIEPPKYRKDGQLSATWKRWNEKKERLANTPPQETLHHLNWRRRMERAQDLASRYATLNAEELDEAVNLGLFNIKSSKQKAWLFYNALGYTPVKFTETGEPAIDDAALRLLGQRGKELIEINELIKEKSYVDAALEYAYHDVIHVALKIPGTLTGRCAGTGGFNLQQQPKTRGYLECFRPRQGYAWIDIDLTAVEPCVLTELSRDKAMLSIYGPEAKTNDIYLFVASQIPGLQEAIRATGYDPYNPTPEAIAKAKKECKALRQLCKVVVLASQYGAGPAKIAETLKADGVEKTLEEVQAIHQAYWQLFAGIKAYEQYLV